MLPILKTKSTLIKSLEYLPNWLREGPAAAYSNSPDGKDFHKVGKGHLPVITCCRPLFYYLAPHMLMFTIKINPEMFLLYIQAPTVLYTQSLDLEFPVVPNRVSVRYSWHSSAESNIIEDVTEKNRLQVMQVLDLLPKLVYLQRLGFTNLEQADVRLYALEQAAKLSRLQSLQWPSFGCRNDEVDQFPLIVVDGDSNRRFTELKESIIKIANAKFASSSSSEHPQEQLQIPVPTSAVYLHAIPLVKLNFTASKPGCELAVALFATSWTLRSLTLSRSGTVLITGDTIRTIATACPRLTELSISDLIVENEDSLRPFSEFGHLEILKLPAAFGVAPKSSPMNYYSYGYETSFTSLRRTLDDRTEEQLESARRGFRHFQSCSGSLREVYFGFNTFGSDTPILSFFGYDDGSVTPCVYPHLRQIDWCHFQELSERALCCMNSHVAPNLTQFCCPMIYMAVTPCEGFTEHVLRHVVGSHQNLESFTTPQVRPKNNTLENNDFGVALINSFITSVSDSNSKNENEEVVDDDQQQQQGFPRSLSSLIIQSTFQSGSSNEEKGGFTKDSIEKYIQQQQQLLLSPQTTKIRHEFCGSNLKKLFVECEISDAFLKIIGESTELRKSIDSLAFGSRSRRHNNEITDEGIFHLRHLGGRLTSFTIYHFNKVTSQGIVKLVQPHFRLLKDVGFMFCNVDDSVLEALQDHLHLDCVVFEGTKITGSGFKYFSKLTNLGCLILQDCKNMTDVQVLAPLDDILVPDSYVDICNSGLFPLGDEHPDNAKVVQQILVKVLNKSFRQGLYVSVN